MGHESVLMRLGVESCKERQIDSTNELGAQGQSNDTVRCRSKQDPAELAVIA